MKSKGINPAAWFAGQSFHSVQWDRKPKTVSVLGYSNIPVEHHIHFCATCQKDYPATCEHLRDGKPETPPRATRHCPECRGF